MAKGSKRPRKKSGHKQAADARPQDAPKTEDEQENPEEQPLASSKRRVRTAKRRGESKDTLARRAEYFSKRRG